MIGDRNLEVAPVWKLGGMEFPMLDIKNGPASGGLDSRRIATVMKRELPALVLPEPLDASSRRARAG